MTSDPAAEIGTDDYVAAVDRAVAIALGTGFEWAVEVEYDLHYGRLVRENKREPFPVRLPEIVARFRYLDQAQRFAKAEFDDSHILIARVKFVAAEPPKARIRVSSSLIASKNPLSALVAADN